MSLPESVVDEAARLTRLAHRAEDANDARSHRDRRDRLLARHGYRAHVRRDDGGLGGARADGDRVEARPDRPARRGERVVLVCYPAEWIDGETVDPAQIEDVSRAIERPLSGPGEKAWPTVESHNRTVADRIADEHGEVHGATAHAFADFMGNHHARRVDEATAAQIAEFRDEYLPRNAWPTDDQLAVLEESIELIRGCIEGEERPSADCTVSDRGGGRHGDR